MQKQKKNNQTLPTSRIFEMPQKSINLNLMLTAADDNDADDDDDDDGQR